MVLRLEFLFIQLIRVMLIELLIIMSGVNKQLLLPQILLRIVALVNGWYMTIKQF